MTGTALALVGVSKRYRAGVAGCSASVVALRAVDVRVNAGEILGLVGPAGAGKSTLLLCAAGLMRPDSGTVMWFGSVARRAVSSRLVAFVPEHSAYALMVARTSCPGLLLLDDTFGTAEPVTDAVIGTALRSLAMEGSAIVVASRDEAALASVATRCVTLVGGEIQSDQRRNRSAARARCSSRSALARASRRSTNGRSFRSPQ